MLISGSPAHRMSSQSQLSIPRPLEKSWAAKAIAKEPVGFKPLAQHQIKATATWQEALWKKWPSVPDWPGILDVYEAAALLRVSPDTIRRALSVGRDGRARLAHSRPAGIYRIQKEDLLAFARVDGRH